MLPCPYCRNALAEDAPACPTCEFDLARAKAVLGPVPRLDPSGLTDFSGRLTKRDLQHIEKARGLFVHHFPQTQVHLVVSRFRTDFPLPVTLFWIFNLGGLSAEDQKQGRNHAILIAVDPDQSVVGLTTGYGLEPFLSTTAIDDTLAGAAPYFQTGDLSAGVVQLLSLLTQKLSTLSREIPSALGLEQELVVGTPAGEY